MRNMFLRFMSGFRCFMSGRYGDDQLGRFLMGTAVVLVVLGTLTGFGLLELAAEVVLFYALFRMFSRNTYRRREENVRFLRKADPAIRWLRLQQNIRRDKDHRYFKCPSCAQQLRVPKGKGRITVTCRSCGAVFEERS